MLEFVDEDHNYLRGQVGPDYHVLRPLALRRHGTELRLLVRRAGPASRGARQLYGRLRRQGSRHTRLRDPRVRHRLLCRPGHDRASGQHRMERPRTGDDVRHHRAQWSELWVHLRRGRRIRHLLPERRHTTGGQPLQPHASGRQCSGRLRRAGRRHGTGTRVQGPPR